MTGARLGRAAAEELHRCTVRIETLAGAFHGSGFLVAPGLAVTAAHVVLLARRADPAAGLTIRHESGAHPVEPAAIRVDPAVGDGTGFHPFPDLATLAMPGWTGHPVAPLAAVEAETGAALTALGYSTFTPSPGARPDTLALRVVGRAGEFVRVQGDGVRQGLSGSLLAGADGLVYGVLKGSRSYEQEQGGWYVPIGALAAFLGEAVAPRVPPAPPLQPFPPSPPSPLPPPTDAELVTALLAFPQLRRSAGRFDLLEAMGARLGLPAAFEAEERGDAREHLHRIVQRCRHYRDERAALRALAAALGELAPYDAALERLRELVGRAVGDPEAG
ncbi:trypsin-like serine peptidase [Kitasatospora sp. LaBMicrA B282]|uniref:trypsin-like serine peptidase n=1 Tax=Kitasatospora sp. LaBMicrA B282 TaxID=3420949 RepID=UPI003D1333D1